MTIVRTNSKKEESWKLAQAQKIHGAWSGQFLPWWRGTGWQQIGLQVLQGKGLHPEYVDLNEAWKKFRDTREAFFWTLKRYHAERGREVPEQVKVLFDTYVDPLASVFHEADLRVSFQEVVDLADQSMTDDE